VWSVVYTDSLSPPNNNVARDPGTSAQEQVTVNPATPSLTTVATPSTGSATTVLNDTITLSGGYHPVGTITVTLTAPDTSTVYTDVITVNGNGTYYTATQGTNPGGILPLESGTYTWHAGYADSLSPPNNLGAQDNSQNETVTVTNPNVPLTWSYWAAHTGYRPQADAWPTNTFTIGSGPSAVTYGGSKNASGQATSSMKIGGVSYSFSQLQSILAAPVTGNGVLNLAHQLIGAILNVANGAGTVVAITEIEQSSLLLYQNSLVMGSSVVTQTITPTSDPTIYNELVTLAVALEAYNSSGV
jgi:hypothetical protein